MLHDGAGAKARRGQHLHDERYSGHAPHPFASLWRHLADQPADLLTVVGSPLS